MLPRPLYTCEQVKALDKAAIEQQGVTGFELMTRAAQASFELVRARWPDHMQLTVLCGGGNNGGDGYVLAALAREAGYDVKVVGLAEPGLLVGDAHRAYELAADLGVPIRSVGEGDELSNLALQGLIVDAMLGIGLTGDVRDKYLQLIHRVNASSLPVLSIDIPSGLNSDTGTVMGGAIRADATITFIAVKRGLLTGNAADVVGELHFAQLGVSKHTLMSQAPSAHRLDYTTPLLPPRAASAHKGSFGRLLVIAGGEGMGGAAILSAESALIAGAGIVDLATHKYHVSAALTRRPELMVTDFQNAVRLKQRVSEAKVLIIGPGLGISDFSEGLFTQIMDASKPMVIDADALTILAQKAHSRKDWVLTPHPGEAARLLGCTAAEIQTDRFAAARRLQESYGGVVVLKGAGTLIASDEGIYVCDGGNPAMAAPGMGDVLAGIIGGLMTQGLSSLQAAKIGVWAHAHAGDLAAAHLGRNLMATDIHAYLRRLW